MHVLKLAPVFEFGALLTSVPRKAVRRVIQKTVRALIISVLKSIVGDKNSHFIYSEHSREVYTKSYRYLVVVITVSVLSDSDLKPMLSLFGGCTKDEMSEILK